MFYNHRIKKLSAFFKRTAFLYYMELLIQRNFLAAIQIGNLIAQLPFQSMVRHQTGTVAGVVAGRIFIEFSADFVNQEEILLAKSEVLLGHHVEATNNEIRRTTQPLFKSRYHIDDAAVAAAHKQDTQILGGNHQELLVREVVLL